jgi:glycosyltransferase involved in cell wall biosynthesis
MIVKDEERNLREGLAPIAKFFDEIVVIDTGSTDASAQVAQSFGAKVIRHPWNNNFAEARNAALKQSAGRWIFWMDADDRIDARAVQTLRKFINRGIPCGVFFPLESRIGEHGSVVKNYTLRLFPNSPGISWQGAVHEQIAQSLRASGIELVNCPDFTIRHLGYEKSEDVIRKNLRNLKLLSVELAARPEDPYILFALAQAFLFCGQIQAAARWLRELWRLREKVDVQSWKEVFWLAAIVLSDCAAASNLSAEAEDWLNQALALAPENWLAYFLLGERKIKAEDFESASSLLHRVEELGVSPTILPLDLDAINLQFRQYLAMLNEKASPAFS